MGGRGSKASRGGAGGVPPPAPEGETTRNGVFESTAAQVPAGQQLGGKPAATVGAFTLGNAAKAGEPVVPLKVPGYGIQKNPNGTGSRKLILHGKDGGSVYSGSKAQATRIANHLDKNNLATNLSNVPTSVL